MVNSTHVEVYCTRPSCPDPINRLSEECFVSKPIRQRFCTTCGMPLILEGRFLSQQLLVSNEERGGFGRTFVALDLNFEQRSQRVIKQLHPRIVSSNQSQMQMIERMFMREGSVLEQLNHPQIPRAWALFVVQAPPDLQDQSIQPSDTRQSFFYLVQEYIKGKNLAQELNEKRKFSEHEVLEILQQLLTVLDYVHAQGVVHRDIKPSNIVRRERDGRLFLIDFGAVKQVVAGVPTEQSLVIGTPDFAPPEQLTRKPVHPSSDLYSLAATCVCLLTGISTQQLRRGDKWFWKQHTNVSDALANIVDRMLSPELEKRFQSAAEVKAELFPSTTFSTELSASHNDPTVPPTHQEFNPSSDNTRKQPPQTDVRFFKKVLQLGTSLLVLGAVALGWFIISYKEDQSLEANYFSRGEETLVQTNIPTEPVCQQAYDKKKEGMTAFSEQEFSNAVKNFQAAISLFKQVSSNPTSSLCSVDPETLIFLNNAQANLKGNPLTIALVVPINQQGSFRKLAEQLLRGVAHVQDNFNNKNGIQGRLLQILIVRDDNLPQIAKLSATHLAKNDIPGDVNFNNNILGVIGHFTSDVTLAAGEIYEREKLVAVSPTSTAIRKYDPNPLSYTFNLSKYVFRTATTDTVAANDLVRYVQKNLGSGKGAILFESTTIYSNSLKEAFETKYAPSGQVVECDLSKKNINECNIAQDVKFIMLSLGTEEAADRNLLSIALFNQKPLLGGDALYNDDKLSPILGEKAENMVLAVTTHIELTDTAFQNKSVQLWGTKYVGWRAATAYDAAQTIIAGLEKQGNNPSREGLYKELSNPTFSTPGATGIVQFDKRGDRKVNPEDNKLGVLVKIQRKCKPSDQQRYSFCLLQES